MARRRAAVRLGFALAWILLATTDARAQAASTDPLTPEAALQRAERSWPGLQAAEQAVRAAEARLDEARFSPWLRATVEAGVSLAPEQRGTVLTSPDSQLPLTNPWQPVAAVSVRGAVPLYTFGKLASARRAAGAGVEAARARHARTRRRLRHQVLRAYFALQLALDGDALLGEADGWLRRARQRLRRALEEDSEEVGPSDERRIELASATLRARRAQLRALQRGARAALGELLRLELERVRLPDCPAEPVALRERPLRAWQREATTRRADLAALQAAVRAREAALEAERAGALPDLALGWRAGVSWAPGITDQRNPFVRDPANYQDLSAGLLLRWPLDPVGSYFRIRTADARLRELRARLEEARRGVRLEVARAHAAWQEARERMEAWTVGSRTARGWVVSALQGYEVGTTSARELVEALKAYLEARWSHLQAVHDHNVAASELWLTAGRDGAPSGGWQPRCPPPDEDE